MSKGTTPRAIRIPDDLWDAAVARAAREGTSVSVLVREALEGFVNAPEDAQKATEPEQAPPVSPLRAGVVSRVLHTGMDIVTVPDHRREGYRVQQSTPTEVRVTAQFDSERTATRKAGHVADFLREKGFTVTQSGGSLYVTRQTTA